jgi:hypothetical protein
VTRSQTKEDGNTGVPAGNCGTKQDDISIKDIKQAPAASSQLKGTTRVAPAPVAPTPSKVSTTATSSTVTAMGIPCPSNNDDSTSNVNNNHSNSDTMTTTTYKVITKVKKVVAESDAAKHAVFL